MRRIVTCCAVAVSLAFGGDLAVAAPLAKISEFSLEPRAGTSSVRAWLPGRDTYSQDYVRAGSRKVRLNGCGSRRQRGDPEGPARVPVLSWLLEPLDGQPDAEAKRFEFPPDQCNTVVRLPALGRWRATLTVRDAGLTDTAEREMNFRELLVVAIGDSFTSGEGNPDFFDLQCHRSRNAWPALLARSLENDSRTVTFVNFACSGARVRHLFDLGYAGIQPRPDDRALRPQLTKLRTLLGNPLNPDTRTVDLLLGSIGINELNVGPSLTDCAIDMFNGTHLAWLGLFLTDCKKDFRPAFGRLPALYDEVELAISEHLRVGQFHIIGYPSRLLTDHRDRYPKKFTSLTCFGLCKVRALDCFPFHNMRVDDKVFVTRSVDTLNEHVRRAALRSGWWTRTPTKDRFRGHGYCSVAFESWFRGLTSSGITQGNADGTAHPTRPGHSETARAVRESVRLEIEPPTPDTFRVRILQLRMTLAGQNRHRSERPVLKDLQADVRGAARVACLLRASAGSALPSGQCQVIEIQATGRTVAVRAKAIVNRFIPLSPPNPAEPHAGVRRDIALTEMRFHRRDVDDWDVGRRKHILVEDDELGELELQYVATRRDEPVVVPTTFRRPD